MQFGINTYYLSYLRSIKLKVPLSPFDMNGEKCVIYSDGARLPKRRDVFIVVNVKHDALYHHQILEAIHIKSTTSDRAISKSKAPTTVIIIRQSLHDTGENHHN